MHKPTKFQHNHTIHGSFTAVHLLGSAVASPGFVARRGKAGNYVMGHSQRTSASGAAAAR